MILDKLGLRRKPNPRVQLVAIYLAPSAAAPMQSVQTAHAVKDRGLAGDRYHDHAGHWQSLEACQVTLLSMYDLAQMKKQRKAETGQGQHRRNLVISGTEPRRLEGKLFRIGEATFEYWKKRPPCAYIDKIAGPGMSKTLGIHAGICLKVLHSGVISVGDELTLV